MTEPTPLCRFCGDVIGVYEPLIVLREGEARETSRAARHGRLCGELYHRACYQLRGEPSERIDGPVRQANGAGKEDSHN